MLWQQIWVVVTLARQATEAQLTMLRYQLNPHFLFNTLNSISTLVLLKQTDRANAMLSRLASFLRYTLVGEPTAQVPVEQRSEENTSELQSLMRTSYVVFYLIKKNTTHK